MKIVGIGANYVKELSDLPEGPVVPMIFTKPDSSLLENNADLKLPSISNDVWFEVEIAYRIGKTCKDVKKEEALEYVDALTLANDLTAVDVLAASREPKKGPWALAKGFDGATPIAAFKPISDFPDLDNINFTLEINGELTQIGNSGLMITKLGALIEYVSAYMTLNPGDILLTGTPVQGKGKGKVNSGDEMVAFLEGEKVLVTKVL